MGSKRVVAAVADKTRSSLTSWNQHLGFETTTTWCRLLTQSSLNPTVSVYPTNFLVGSSKQANVLILDQTISAILCSIRLTQGSSKDAETMKEGINTYKVCNTSKQVTRSTVLSKDIGLSSGEADIANSPSAPLGSDSLKMEPDVIPNSVNAAKNSTIKLGDQLLECEGRFSCLLKITPCQNLV